MTYLRRILVKMQQQENEGEEGEQMENQEQRGDYDEMDFEREDEFNRFNAYENNFSTNPTSNSGSKY